MTLKKYYVEIKIRLIRFCKLIARINEIINICIKARIIAKLVAIITVREVGARGALARPSMIAKIT